METQLYQDTFGVMIYDDARNMLELRWFAETASMTDDDYMGWLERYAAEAVQYHVPFTLIDTRAFKHHPGAHTGPWREECYRSNTRSSSLAAVEKGDPRQVSHLQTFFEFE